jgi:glutamate transport system permease protein
VAPDRAPGPGGRGDAAPGTGTVAPVISTRVGMHPASGSLAPSLIPALVIPIVLGNAAVVAEIFRAGVLSLERGQTEAPYSARLTSRQAMRRVVVPQAARRLVPALVSQRVRLLKDSTLGYVVSYLELLHKAQVLGEYYHAVLSTHLVAAACYVAINASLSKTASWLEVRQAD